MNTQTAANEHFREIFKNCEEGILVTDHSGQIKLVNEAISRLFEYSENELVGLNVDQLVPLKHRKDHHKHRDGYNTNQESRRMGVGRDLQGLKKNGEVFPVEVSLNKVELDGVAHTVAFVIDISERKAVEDALMRSEEQLIVYATELEKRVTKRTEELDRTIEQLEKEVSTRKKAEKDVTKALEHERELNELKSRFVAMASHEFRTPLSTILSSASLIEKYIDEQGQEKRERHVMKIKSAINNLTGILDDFLSLSKLEEGRIDITKSSFVISDMVHEIVQEMRSITKEGQQIIFNRTGEDIEISSDKKIVKNILINLISNAIKYSDKEINVEVHQTSEFIDMEVRDTGIGIAKEEQKRLFERFFRAKNATNIQGTGLGLNIVKKYVDMLSGDISFTSELNVGSTFKVKLPIRS